MGKYKLSIELKTQALIGSAEGFGAIIDSDIVFDDYGIPYIPSKRIKGCLRDSAMEVCDIFDLSNISIFKNNNNKYHLVDKIFGKTGETKSSPLYISNLYIHDGENLKEWLQYLSKNYYYLINPEVIKSYFTKIIQHTAIDESGVAKEHSLRTIRVAKKGFVFEGDLEIKEENEDLLKLLYLACLNLRRFGTKRNRGFGEIRCKILQNGNEINFQKDLEVL